MKDKGFSIIELIVTTSVIAIISLIVFSGYRQSGQATLLDDQASAIVVDIEAVRGTALSAKSIKTDQGNQVDYYTLHFEENAVVLFKETEEERRRNLEGEVKIKEGAGKSVGFRPPQPEVIFFDSEGEEMEDGNLEITVGFPGEGDNDQSLKVIINRAGLAKMVTEND